MLLLTLTACPKQKHSSAQAIPASTPAAIVVLHGKKGTRRIRVELALTPQERERGLMFRKHLPQDQGMLFVFERPQRAKFWMKNTYIPLDMIFVDDSGWVVGIVRDARPLSTDLVGPDRPFRYVIEVNAGITRRIGLDVGSSVDILWPNP